MVKIKTNIKELIKDLVATQIMFDYHDVYIDSKEKWEKVSFYVPTLTNDDEWVIIWVDNKEFKKYGK